jgi:hypothetical protein
MTEDKIYQQIEKDIDQLALHLGQELNAQIQDMFVRYQSDDEKKKDPTLESLDKESYIKYIKENATISCILKRMAMSEVIQKYNNEQQVKITAILSQIQQHVFKIPVAVDAPAQSAAVVEDVVDEKAKEASDYFYHLTTQKGDGCEV